MSIYVNNMYPTYRFDSYDISIIIICSKIIMLSMKMNCFIKCIKINTPKNDYSINLNVS